jgi:hypothetical protein
MRPTLIAIHHFEIDGHVFHHGVEIIPGLIDDKTLDKLLDQGRVRETERRSLYRLFPAFSGATEKQSLDDDELDEFALPK